MSRDVGKFLLTFASVFAGLALLHGPGPVYAHAHALLGNAVLHCVSLREGARLWFEAAGTEAAPWSVTLHVQSLVPRGALTVPIDLRSLVYLPAAAFIGLSIAVPLRSLREHLWLLGIGMLLLESLLLLLVSVPLLSFLGGTGPIAVCTLGRGTHVLLQLIYRALVLPPGMTYALPLFVWWILLKIMRRRPLATASDKDAPAPQVAVPR